MSRDIPKPNKREFEPGKAKIITTSLKYSRTGINTLKYFVDCNLSLT